VKSAWRFQLAVAVISVLAAEAAYRSGVFTSIEYLYSDVWHRASGVRYQPEHVALVVVDDKSLADHGDDPMVFWTPLFARAAGTLRQVGASVIGVDFLFAITPENWITKFNLANTEGLRDFDLAFRQELNSGKVVLVGATVRGNPGQPDGLLLAHTDYLLSLPNTDFVSHIGFADLVPDEDGGMRHYQIIPKLNLPPDVAEGAPRVALAPLLAIRATGQNPTADEWDLGNLKIGADRVSTISYTGPPGTIPRVSMSQVLADDAEKDPAVQALRGKVVIIGADFQGMNDIHTTPYSGGLIGNTGALMAGVEIQANIVETLLAGRATEPVPAWLRLLVFAVFIGATTWFYQKQSPWAGLAVLALAVAAALAVGFATFQRYREFPSAHMQSGLVTAYVMAFGARLTREERERARIKKMFQGYVSDSVVDMLLSSEQRLDLLGESMHITVLFSDIRNFTTISERLTARETVEFLNAYFEKVITVITEEGGRIDKFIGDAVMAEFGVPYHFSDHPLRAVRAAVRMKATAKEFQGWMRARFPDKDLPEFNVGVGLHTGDAVVGNLGSEARMEYTAIGDTVNVASRLEGETKKLGFSIAASVEVVQGAGAQVETGRSQTITVKGREEPIEVFEILGVRSDVVAV
jgi:adenylate cyclase